MLINTVHYLRVIMNSTDQKALHLQFLQSCLDDLGHQLNLGLPMLTQKCDGLNSDWDRNTFKK